jgi:hypothetical protein
MEGWRVTITLAPFTAINQMMDMDLLPFGLWRDLDSAVPGTRGVSDGFVENAYHKRNQQW